MNIHRNWVKPKGAVAQAASKALEDGTDSPMLHRLAQKAVKLAAEYGVDMTYAEAMERSMHNLAYVRAKAIEQEAVAA